MFGTPHLLVCLQITFLLHTTTMPRRHELKPHERSEIIGQYKTRVPLKAISRNLGVPRPTVQYTVKKSETRDEQQHNVPGRGQLRKTTQAQDDRLYRHLRVNDDLRWSEIDDLMPIRHTNRPKNARNRQKLSSISPPVEPVFEPRKYLRKKEICL